MLPVNLKISMKASHIDRHSNIPIVPIKISKSKDLQLSVHNGPLVPPIILTRESKKESTLEIQ